MDHNRIPPLSSEPVGLCRHAHRNPSSKSAVAQSRRGFLCSATAGAALGLVGIAMTSSPASAQSTVSPDEALKAMMDGNDRFVAGQLRSFDLKNL
jgi:hypothetical protein